MKKIILKTALMFSIPLSIAATPATNPTPSAPASAPAATANSAAPAKANAKIAKIELHTEFVNGGTAWMPAEIHVKPGKYLLEAKHDIKEAQDFHGLQIKDLGIEAQVNRHQTFTKEVTITAAMKGKHDISCQFHPKHKHSTLIVD